MGEKEPDFSGYATKANLKCSDGRTILPNAFKHQDKMRVPLVWQHGHTSIENVLGHVDLEATDEGDMRCNAYFNESKSGQYGKTVVEHGDVDKLSIYANQLVEKSKQVVHGVIREVSLVLAGANPGARIDYVRIAHGDGPDDIEVLDDEATIQTGLLIEHSSIENEEDLSEEDEDLSHADDENTTMQEVFDTLTKPQRDVVEYMIGQAYAQGKDAISHADISNDATVKDVFDTLTAEQKEVVYFIIGEAISNANSAEHSALDTPEGNEMTHNVFEQGQQSAASLRHAAMEEARSKLDPAKIQNIFSDMQKYGSLKESFIAHAGDYGIDNIDVLFPDARLDPNGVTIISRRMEWVNNVLTNTKHSPFSRIKSVSADLTADEARAKGYVKGSLKKDEVIKLLKRVTTPKTVYKKQKLDRDDILDITDLDIVAWLKAEMRIMLDEEIARAVLVGDGRDADDEDKIDEDHIRPIAYDNDMYAHKYQLPSDVSDVDLIDEVVVAMDEYKGTGQPTLYTTQKRLTRMMLAKDGQQRRLYPTKADLAAALLVRDIVPVESMEEHADIVGIIVNLQDYQIGADQGGNVAMFDDFDIDYNQQKYLIETRISGALTKPKSAIVLMRNSGRIITPQAPTFNSSTGVLTIPSQANVVYVNPETNTTYSSGAQTAIAPRATIHVEARPAEGYGLTHLADKDWSFTRDAS